MGKINVGKLIVGGLLAGLVMNVFDIVTYMFVLAGDMEAWARKMNMDPKAMQSTGAMMTFITCDFLLGLLVVWIYAAIRPRFGPGPKTAVFAALAFFLTIEVATFGLTTMGIFDVGFFFKTSIFALVNWTVSAVVGAAVYKEA